MDDLWPSKALHSRQCKSNARYTSHKKVSTARFNGLSYFSCLFCLVARDLYYDRCYVFAGRRILDIPSLRHSTRNLESLFQLVARCKIHVCTQHALCLLLAKGVFFRSLCFAQCITFRGNAATELTYGLATSQNVAFRSRLDPIGHYASLPRGEHVKT